MTGTDEKPRKLGDFSGLEVLRQMIAGAFPAPPFAATSSIWLVSAEEGRVVFEAEPSAAFNNPMGVVHGGWISILLDSAMGCAVHASLKAGQSYTTLELKTVFVRSVRESTGKLTCEGRLLHQGSRVASAEGKIFDAAGRLVAHGSETCLISDRT